MSARKRIQILEAEVASLRAQIAGLRARGAGEMLLKALRDAGNLTVAEDLAALSPAGLAAYSRAFDTRSAAVAAAGDRMNEAVYDTEAAPEQKPEKPEFVEVLTSILERLAKLEDAPDRCAPLDEVLASGLLPGRSGDEVEDLIEDRHLGDHPGVKLLAGNRSAVSDADHRDLVLEVLLDLREGVALSLDVVLQGHGVSSSSVECGAPEATTRQDPPGPAASYGVTAEQSFTAGIGALQSRIDELTSAVEQLRGREEDLLSDLGPKTGRAVADALNKVAKKAADSSAGEAAPSSRLVSEMTVEELVKAIRDALGGNGSGQVGVA